MTTDTVFLDEEQIRNEQTIVTADGDVVRLPSDWGQVSRPDAEVGKKGEPAKTGGRGEV